MFIVKRYFFSRNWLFLLLPFLIFLLAFWLHYKLVINYQENLFANTIASVRDEILNDEKTIFKLNIIGNTAVFILQIIGTIFCLNIGFLLFNYKFSFIQLMVTVIKTSIILAFAHVFVLIGFYFYYKVYSFNDLYNIEYLFSLKYFFKGVEQKWLVNILETISLTQMLYALTLVLGLKYMMNWPYKKAFFNTIVIYGLSTIIWLGFATVMDLNFNQ